MRKLLKALLVIVLFAVCYGGIMVFAYDMFYEYPKGILDKEERADEARYYALVLKTKVDRNTTLYFTRANNGVGTTMHFGTVDSDKPDIIANFFCETTSSVYFPTETVAYVTANSSDQMCYLFGATSDENTVMVDVTFYISEDETKTYEMIYDNFCYYFVGFDKKYAQYTSTVTGYNSDGYATFIHYCDAMEEGVAANQY